MTTQISTKFAALGVALLVNSTLFGGIAYLFNGKLHDRAPVTSMASTVALHTTVARVM